MTDDRARQFGFRTVAPEDKAGLVGQVFSSVAQRYDLMNDLMSAGVHRLWKDAAVDWLAPRPGLAYLDVAGGTGDIAFRIQERTAPKGGADVTICDINPDMLAAGRGRPEAARFAGRLTWVAGNAEALPFPDASFDAYTIAFGIRNVTHLGRALSDAFRVLKPGGRFLCLEFSRVDVPGLDALYDAWSFKAIPAIGAMVAGDRAAYRYLVESIRRFPPQAAFAATIRAAGFSQVKARNLTGGIAALHSGWKF